MPILQCHELRCIQLRWNLTIHGLYHFCPTPAAVLPFNSLYFLYLLWPNLRQWSSNDSWRDFRHLFTLLDIYPACPPSLWFLECYFRECSLQTKAEPFQCITKNWFLGIESLIPVLTSELYHSLLYGFEVNNLTAMLTSVDDTSLDGLKLYMSITCEKSGFLLIYWVEARGVLTQSSRLLAFYKALNVFRHSYLMPTHKFSLLFASVESSIKGSGSFRGLWPVSSFASVPY